MLVPGTCEGGGASGDARILVPPGDEKYNVSAETDSGDDDIGVAQGGDERFLRVESNSGDVTVDYGG